MSAIDKIENRFNKLIDKFEDACLKLNRNGQCASCQRFDPLLEEYSPLYNENPAFIIKVCTRCKMLHEKEDLYNKMLRGDLRSNK